MSAAQKTLSNKSAEFFKAQASDASLVTKDYLDLSSARRNLSGRLETKKVIQIDRVLFNPTLLENVDLTEIEIIDVNFFEKLPREFNLNKTEGIEKFFENLYQSPPSSLKKIQLNEQPLSPIANLFLSTAIQIDKLAKLQTLYLRCNQLDGQHIADLLKSFVNRRAPAAVEKLCLEFNLHRNAQIAIVALAEAIAAKKFPQLEWLFIRDYSEKPELNPEKGNYDVVLSALMPIPLTSFPCPKLKTAYLLDLPTSAAAFRDFSKNVSDHLPGLECYVDTRSM